MRIIVFALCALTCLGSLGAGRLLVLTEPVARGHLGSLLEKWRTRVLYEGHWTEVTIIELSRWTGTYAVNDWPGLNRMRDAVALFQPSAVQIIGRLPPLMSGGHAQDGHELRRIVNDHWLGCTNLVFTDNLDWGMPGTVAGQSSLIGTNIPGDGIPDQTQADFSIPVCRLDASGLTAFSGNFAAGYLAGTPYQPAIDEAYWLRCYMTNNLAYRNKQWTVDETGVFGTPCCWFNSATISSFNTSVTWSSVVDTGLGGGRWRWMYDSLETSLISPGLFTAEGVPARVFWNNVYKSYCMEIAGGQCTYVRRLFPGYVNQPFALISGWCQGGFSQTALWVGTAADVTVADAIRTSVARYSGGSPPYAYPFAAWLAGDLTLPIDVITQDPLPEAAIGDLTVGTVSP